MEERFVWMVRNKQPSCREPLNFLSWHSEHTGLLFLSATGVWLDMGVGDTCGTEVVDGFSVLGSSKQESVCAYYNFILELAREKQSLTCWGLQNELVKGDAFASSFNDSCASGFGETESCDSELWNGVKSLIISHSSNNNDSAISAKVSQTRLDLLTALLLNV